jgi:hypothetical protein
MLCLHGDCADVADSLSVLYSASAIIASSSFSLSSSSSSLSLSSSSLSYDDGGSTTTVMAPR